MNIGNTSRQNAQNNSNNIQRDRQTELQGLLGQIESLRKRIEDVYHKEKTNVEFNEILSSFRVVSKHIDELTNKIMYNPKNSSSDDFLRSSLRHEIVAPHVPDINLLNVLDTRIHNEDSIFPHQNVHENSNTNNYNDSNIEGGHDRSRSSAYNGSINEALKYLDSLLNPDSEDEYDDDDND